MDDASKSIPFGYTLVNNANNDAPSGPPLLDNHESGYLQTFFDNPNNIDPSFLGGAQADRSAGGQDAFLPRRGSHQQNWMVDAGAGFPGPAVPHSSPDRSGFAAPSAPPAAQGGRMSYGPAAGFNPAFASPHPHQRPPDDVYAAARLLHDSQSPQGHGHADAFRGQQPDPKGAANPTYNYPQPPSGTYAGLPQSYAYPKAANMDAQQAARAGRANPKQTRQLNFGSDSKFRMNKYAAPKNERWPDQELVNAVIASHPMQHGWEDEQIRMEAAQAAEALSRKRRRTPVDGDESEEGDEDDVDHKRIKGESGDGIGNGNDEHDGVARAKSGKRKSGRASSPSKGKRSPVEPPKPAKENLSEEQKRANHIQSEQKRRNLIRQGFEDANRMVPELRAGGFSKSNMLLEAAKFMRELKQVNSSMRPVLDVLDKG